jgi:flagellar motor protein MotB
MAVREQEGEGGDGYFASVSDLMVGILFVFLLMLTVFALNYREAEHDQEVSREKFAIEEQKAKLAEEEARLAEDRARQQAARADGMRKLLEQAATELQQNIDATSNARDRLLTTLETDLNQRGLKVTVDRQAGILHLPGDLLFGTLSATLGLNQRSSVGVLANALARTLPCFTPIDDRATRCPPGDLPILETVLVEGHTDRRPISNAGSAFRDNDQLSTERALAVFAEIQRAQPRLNELFNADRSYPLLGVSGFGAQRPLPDAQGDTEPDYALNRRIDLRFLLARTAELERLRSQIEAALEETKK